MATRSRAEDGVPASAPDDVLLRAMSSDDLPQVLELERATFSMAWTEATFRGLLRRRDVSALVAEAAGRIAGYAVCWFVREQGELANIAVAPERRGQGLGARLLVESLARMEEKGVRQVYLEVRESNRAAQRFYDGFGFRQVGRRRNYYVKPREDALVLYRELGGAGGT